MAKFIFYVSTNIAGSEKNEEIEIPDEEIEGMTEIEIDRYVYETYYQDWLNNECEMSFWREDD